MMTYEQMQRLTKEREGKKDYPFIAVVKYSRCAIPIKYGMESETEALNFVARKFNHNPHVRWTQVIDRFWLLFDFLKTWSTIASEIWDY